MDVTLVGFYRRPLQPFDHQYTRRVCEPALGECMGWTQAAVSVLRARVPSRGRSRCCMYRCAGEGEAVRESVRQCEIRVRVVAVLPWQVPSLAA
jgi:hypothetical protein